MAQNQADDEKKEQESVTPGAKEDENKEEEKPPQPVAKPGEEEKLQEQKDGEQMVAQGDQVISQEILQQQEAEKLIRSVEDKIGKYLFRPTKEQLKGKSNNGNDW